MFQEARMFRSMLLAPADDLHKITKAISSGADAVVIDLEDAVAPSAKAHAREVMVRAPQAKIPIYVRVNPVRGEHFIEDVEVVLGMHVQGIIVPKIESASDMEVCNWYLSQRENSTRQGEARLDIIPVLENARGISNMKEVFGASTRSSRASYGAGDLTADTGIIWTDDELTLHSVRAQMTIESKAAGLLPPLDSPHWEFRDLDQLKASAERGRKLGFGGKGCIHPAQLQTVNDVFSPTDEELAWARRVLAEFEVAAAAGKGVITVDGLMVDLAVARRARSVLENPVGRD